MVDAHVLGQDVTVEVHGQDVTDAQGQDVTVKVAGHDVTDVADEVLGQDVTAEVEEQEAVVGVLGQDIADRSGQDVADRLGQDVTVGIGSRDVDAVGYGSRHDEE